MREKSRLVLPCDPEYTAHREAEQRLQETREWLLQRERVSAAVAPSIVPEVPEEKLRVEHRRTSSHSRVSSVRPFYDKGRPGTKAERPVR